MIPSFEIAFRHRIACQDATIRRRREPPHPVYPDLTCEPAYRYVGGKTGLLDKRPDLFPPREKVRVYHEPFVGGGAVFFRRYAGLPAVLNDANRPLTITLRYLGSHTEQVLDELTDLVAAYNAWTASGEPQAFYLVQREHFHAPQLAPWRRAALFLFLLQANFNGLWRTNRAGRFNVGWGKKKKLDVDVPKLLAAGRALRSAVVRNVDFEEAVLDGGHGKLAVREGAFCYFDPPYAPVSKTASFNAYSGGDWGPKGRERLRLAALLRGLQRRGIRFLASDADTPETREVYAGLHVETVQMERAVNSRGDRRGCVSELLITGERS